MTRKEPVLVLNVPSVGLTLKVQADIAGKQSAYLRRISDDHDEKNLQVDYSANVDCSINGKAYRVGGEPVRLLPLFFETRYFFRGDFEPVDGKRVKSVRVDHRLASVADSFDFSDGTLVGTLDFINEPGRFRLDLVITLSDDSERTVRFEFVVVSVKMNVLRDYGEIVDTIEKAKPNIVRAFLSKTFWGARLDDAAEGDAKSWYEILIDVFGFYESACRRIIHDPHRRYVREEEWIRADRLRRWTPQTANRFFALPRDRQDCECFRTERIGSEIDTPENRFVLYT